MNDADRPGLFFLDTNIFVYSFDVTSPHKQQIAQQLIRQALEFRRGVISTQVVQEFLNVSLRKFARLCVGVELYPDCRLTPHPWTMYKKFLTQRGKGCKRQRRKQRVCAQFFLACLS